jgi:hypothetical protein
MQSIESGTEPRQGQAIFRPALRSKKITKIKKPALVVLTPPRHPRYTDNSTVPTFVPTTEPYRLLPTFEGSRSSPSRGSTCSIRWYFVAVGVTC